MFRHLPAAVLLLCRFAYAGAEEGTCDAKTGVCTEDAGKPHGGTLVSTYVATEDGRKALEASASATLELSERQACDVALLITGGFSPLTGFMKQGDYDGVVEDMRTKEQGVLFG